MMNSCGPFVFVCAACFSILGFGNALGIVSVEPLELASDFTPSISFSETHTDSVKKTIDPLNSSNVTYDVVAALSTTATVTANMKSLVLSDVDSTTVFALNLGAAQISFKLGDIPTYTKGQTTAFYCWNGWDANKKALGTGGVKLVWTATKLTVTVTMSNEVSRPLPIGTEAFISAGDTPGTFPIKDTLTADVTFAGITTSVPRTVYVTGTYKVTHVRSGPVDTPVYEFDLFNITETGAADYARPVVALTSPPQGASVAGTVDVNGSASDEKGLTAVEWTTDLNRTWAATDQFSFSASPPDGLWGPTSAIWTVGLSNLPHGINRLWVRSVDDSGNRSLPLQVSLVNSLLPVLTGRWDALLVPDVVNGVRGALSFTLSSNGNFTGSLVLEGGSYPIVGAMLPNESLAAAIKRSVGQSSIDLAATITTFSPSGESAAAISGTLKTGGTALASFAAYRSPWSTTKLAPATLAGRFHVKVDPSASPTGNSYAVITTARAGAASAAFALADGSVVTWSGVMGANGQLPVFALLYGGKGSVSSPMMVDGGTRTVGSTTVRWFRPPAFADKQFPAGFEYDALAASGLAYTAPVPSNARVMGLTSSSATARWSGDDVSARSQAISINLGNTIAITSPTDALSLAVTASTGLWTGSFKIPGSSVLSTCRLLIVGSQAYGSWSAPAPTGSVVKRYGIIHIQ